MAAEAPADWYRSFFAGPASSSGSGRPTEDQTRQEADFVQEALRVEPPARLLDVPCGGGRHSLALARRGFAMTAVDLSSEFLAAARSQPQEGVTPIAWEEREMRDLPWASAFDGAFCLGNSFGYLDDEGNAAFLRAVAAALKPGARFVLDTGYVTDALLPNLQERSWYDLGDLIMLAQRRYDPITGRLHVEYQWIRDGHVVKRSMSARLSSYRELHSALEQAGFTDVQGYSSLSREPFRLASPRLLLIATRRDRP